MPSTARALRPASCVCAAALALAAVGPAPAQPPTVPEPAAARFFESNVRPVLAARCFECHGPAKQSGKLRLDSLAAALKGGRTGPAVAPGRPDESLLVNAVRHAGELQMPPKSKLLPKEIADLTRWVAMGAPWPGQAAAAVANGGGDGPAFTKEQREFWAFRPPAAPPLPEVRDRAWVRSPIDHFILAKLEEKGLPPAPPADRRTLLRRVTFDLIGLPPTPEEIDAFLTDRAPDAYEKVVDRLLASPHYGERWGRRWLDVARYADSNGMDENLAYASAWRYRDWVVSAFNRGLPYDQFVRAQVAGDLLPGLGPEGVVATGFLCVGPKMLAEDDPVKMEMDLIDEQIDTIGRTFLGLTLGCARCHDHKFDPVSMKDYYALAGIFKSTRTMENFRVVARWQERPVAAAAELERAKKHQEAVARAKEAVAKLAAEQSDRLVTEARGRAEAYARAAVELRRSGGEERAWMDDPARARAKGTLVIEAEDYARGNVLKSFDGYGAGIGVVYNRGELPNVAEYDVTLPAAGAYRVELRYAAAESRPVALSVNGRPVRAQAAGRVTGSWFPDTQAWDVQVVVALPAGNSTLRLERAGPFPHLDKLALLPDTLPPGVTHSLPGAHLEAAAARGLNPSFLRQWVRYLERTGSPPAGDALRKVAEDPKGPFAIPADVEGYYPKDARERLQSLRDELARLDKTAPKLPEAMAVSEGPPVNLRVHLRGSHLTLGKEVPRRFPQVISLASPPAVGPRGSGRSELADWLTRPDHPLTARVMVNRVWQGHFGTALVRSPDNFGLLGDRPAHRPLLDWLAVRFVREGWSVKAMHRLILLSSTYRMSTAYNEHAARIDPDNRLHWRMNRRRLEAEALRDALLAVGGRLDRRVGGTLLESANRAYVTGTANRNYDKYDSDRRSLYLPVIRSALYDVFQAFDFPDPSVAAGERASTTVAPQALFMMNGKLVAGQTRALAADLLSGPGDDAGRVRSAYLRAYGRPPSEAEVARALAFVGRVGQALPADLDSAERRLRSWPSLCRVLVAANEFVYVE
jgi:hypothetical protein